MPIAGMSESGPGPARVQRAETGEAPPFEIESIDLERLAEEVILLLKRELRLERERQGSFPRFR